MKNGRVRMGAWMRLYESVYVCVCICESAVCGNGGWESEERCSGSAVRRTRGTVVPSLIPSSLLLPLPCSSAQGEDATGPDAEVYGHRKKHERD